jgi:hypothetical protein
MDTQRLMRWALLISLVALLASGVALAASAPPATPEDDYAISWWTVDGGGTTASSGGSYALGGAIGQPDAGLMSGGDYTLSGGFWGGGPAMHNIYLPLVIHN